MSHRNGLLSLALIAALTGVGVAQASPVVTTPTPGVTVYTSAAAFASATSGPSTIGFQGIITPPATYAIFTTLSNDGVTFRDGDRSVYVNVTAADYYAPIFSYPADFLVDSANGDSSNTLNITFASSQTAVGLDFGSLLSGAATLTASTGTVVSDSAPPSAGSTEFIGFVSSAPITSLALTITGGDYILEDVVLATPVAEPGAWVLILLGFGGLGGALRYKRVRGTAAAPSAC